jgi:hypothetical protein
VRRTLIAASLLLGVACTKEPDNTAAQFEARDRKAVSDAIEAHRERVEPILHNLREIGAAAAAAPPVAAPERDHVPGHTIATTLAELDQESAQTLIIPVDSAVDPGSHSTSSLHWEGNQRLPRIAKLLEGGEIASHDSGTMLTRQFEVLEGLYFVLVVRVAEYRPFDPATIRGDAIMFKLADKKRIGAFPFEITQSESAGLYSDEGVDEALERAFIHDVGHGLRERLKDFLAGR